MLIYTSTKETGVNRCSRSICQNFNSKRKEKGKLIFTDENHFVEIVRDTQQTTNNDKNDRNTRAMAASYP